MTPFAVRRSSAVWRLVASALSVVLGVVAASAQTRQRATSLSGVPAVALPDGPVVLYSADQPRIRVVPITTGLSPSVGPRLLAQRRHPRDRTQRRSPAGDSRRRARPQAHSWRPRGLHPYPIDRSDGHRRPSRGRPAGLPHLLQASGAQRPAWRHGGVGTWTFRRHGPDRGPRPLRGRPVGWYDGRGADRVRARRGCCT